MEGIPVPSNVKPRGVLPLNLRDACISWASNCIYCSRALAEKVQYVYRYAVVNPWFMCKFLLGSGVKLIAVSDDEWKSTSAFQYFWISCTQINVYTHTDKYIPNLVNSNQICITITLFRYIWHLSEFRLVLNLSKNGNYNINLVWINQIRDRFFWVQLAHLQLVLRVRLRNSPDCISVIP